MTNDDKPTRLNQSGLARLLGVKRQAVHDLVKRGVIVAGEDGLIDVATATAALAQHLRADAKSLSAILATQPGNDAQSVAAVPSAPTFDAQKETINANDATSYHVARTLRELAEARMAQLKLRTMAGELVEAERVRRAVTTLAATVRAGFERIPDKLSERLAVIADPQAIQALLSAEIDQVLTDLSNDAKNLKLEPTDGRT